MKNYSKPVPIRTIYDDSYVYRYYDVKNFLNKWNVIEITYGGVDNGQQRVNVKKMSVHKFRYLAEREAEKLWNEDLEESKYNTYEKSIKERLKTKS